jgi:hypothetical protein
MYKFTENMAAARPVHLQEEAPKRGELALGMVGGFRWGGGEPEEKKKQVFQPYLLNKKHVLLLMPHVFFPISDKYKTQCNLHMIILIDSISNQKEK